MPTTMNDTIAAVSSPFGEGAVAVLRMSGPAAVEILGKVFDGPQDMPPRQMVHGRIMVDGAVLDEVLAVIFRGPKSFTGEDLAEIHCHGGILVTRRILDALLQNGARMAEPGEFSLRAFANGKMDLTQAEAVMDVIRAQTDLALRAAQQQLAGRLGEHMAGLRQSLLEILAHVEAYIDFPDEDIAPETGRALLARIKAAANEITGLLATADQGRMLREGVLTVITGAPNVGKSSLLNALSGFERAIVSPTPGTTRDTIEERINLDGIPLRLTDTAGIRATGDEVEQMGVERSLKALEGADLVLHVHAAPEPPPDSLPGDERAILVLNKSDLGRHPGWPGDSVMLSCLEGTGFAELRAAISRKIFGGDLRLENVSVAINARHQQCLQRALQGCQAGMAGLSGGTPVDLVAIELHSALDAIGEVMGKVESDEILGEIFSSFCIGK